MKARFRLTVMAEADFEEIGGYTFEMWGEKQADRYLTQLDQTFAMLTNASGMGKDRHDLAPNMMSCPCNRHVIFFRRDAKGDVEILRILHERMDFVRHF